MIAKTEKWPGRAALLVAHCAGMIDLVALPIWIHDLIGKYQFDPQQAGLMVTLFLVGILIASLIVAPRFNRLNTRLVATLGFCASAAAFVAASFMRDFMSLALLHAVGGLGAGFSLSVTHGTIGRSANPHRLFAYANTAIGVLAVVFIGVTSKLVETMDGAILFQIFAGVMAIGAIVSAVLFPAVDAQSDAAATLSLGRFSSTVWCGILGISCLALNQAMIFSFIERIGIDRGFGVGAVTGVLIALGFINLIPGPMAALLQKRISANTVVIVGPILQAIAALVITTSTTFWPYAIPTALYVTIIIFTHVFAFGLLARLDTTGRALAGTPAMLMVGSAIGPILGGTLVKSFGIGSIGIAATIVALIAVGLFSQAKAAKTTTSVAVAAS